MCRVHNLVILSEEDGSSETYRVLVSSRLPGICMDLQCAATAPLLRHSWHAARGLLCRDGL